MAGNRLRRKRRPAAVNPNRCVERNDRSMSNGLLSAKDAAMFDQCRGIHGASRERKGAKRATSAARRRRDRRVIEAARDER